MKKLNRVCFYPFVIMGVLLMLTNSCEKEKEDDNSDAVTDIDGNVYQTVTIGTQTWMVENLKVTHYRNGNAIANVTDNAQWGNFTTGAYCNYNNAEHNSTDYGRLYNWYAVHDSRNIAPKGWHVATDEEWTTLITFLGGIWVAGGKLKENGYAHWFSPNTEATNEYGFNALPGGLRGSDGTFGYIGSEGYWWCSTTSKEAYVPSCQLFYEYGTVARPNYSKEIGMSVRCIKDSTINF